MTIDIDGHFFNERTSYMFFFLISRREEKTSARARARVIIAWLMSPHLRNLLWTIRASVRLILASSAIKNKPRIYGNFMREGGVCGTCPV